MTGHDPGLGSAFQNPVMVHLAAALGTAHQDNGLKPLILLADGDPAAPTLLLIHPADRIAWDYRHLARRVGGVQHLSLDPTVPLPGSLDAFARPWGADHGSWSGGSGASGRLVRGGIPAQTVTTELANPGRQAGLIAALDGYPADVWQGKPEPDPAAALRAAGDCGECSRCASRSGHAAERSSPFCSRATRPGARCPRPCWTAWSAPSRTRAPRPGAITRHTDPYPRGLGPQGPRSAGRMWRPYRPISTNCRCRSCIPR